MMHVPVASRFRRSRLASLVLATALCAAAAPARAAEGDTTAEASAPSEEAVKEAGKRYETGLGMYAEGEFKLAVIEFERAYTLVPDYRVLYNIGQVRIQLGNYARARQVLEQYLKDGGDRISPDRKQSVQNDLTMLEGRTATLRITTSVPGASIYVDDRPVGTAPLADPVLLDAGDHRVTVRVDGREPNEKLVTLAGRDATEIQLDPGKALDSNRSVVVVDRRGETNRSTWMWATWSAAGVLAVGAGVTGGLGIKAANELEDMRETPGANRAELDSAQRRARTLLFTADVLGIAAIATGGVALYLTLSGPDEKKKQPKVGKVSAELRPNWVGVNGSF
ncbi:MAG TPA: PEGA domain-containing protein [Polyangiaceae bacterium]